MQIKNDWVYLSFSEAIEKISTNKKKIKQKDYLETGKIPIVDQGQQLIGGYTNDESKALNCELPVIVFGDHTKVVKFINFKFAPGADGVKVIKPLNCFNPKLFAYFLQVLARKIPDKGYARHFQFIEKEIIPVPPLHEQRQIVSILEELFSKLEAGIESLKKAKEQLKMYRQAVLKWAFEGKLTEKWRKEHAYELEPAKKLLEKIKAEREKHYQQKIEEWKKAVKEWEKSGKKGRKPSKPKKPKELPPLTPEELAELPQLPEGWVWERLNLLTLGVEYGTSKKSKKQGKVPVLRMGNIQNFRFDWSDLVFTDDEEDIAKYRLRKNDVLFNRTNSPELVGKTAIFKGEREAIFAGYLIRINQISTIVDPDYLNYFLNSIYARNYGNKIKTDGVNQSNISGEKLLRYPFPYCSLKEQQAIIQEIEKRFSVVDKLEQIIDESLQKAEALRQSILKKAFEGNLTRKWREEHPELISGENSAEALLERIKAEKAKISANNKKKRRGKKKPSQLSLLVEEVLTENGDKS